MQVYLRVGESAKAEERFAQMLPAIMCVCAVRVPRIGLGNEGRPRIGGCGARLGGICGSGRSGQGSDRLSFSRLPDSQSSGSEMIGGSEARLARSISSQSAVNGCIMFARLPWVQWLATFKTVRRPRD